MISSIIVFLLFAFSANPFISTASKLYNKNGTLIAAPQFKISKRKLKTFEAIEKPLCDSILKKIKPIPIYAENEIALEVVFAVEINDKGEVVDCRYVYLKANNGRFSIPESMIEPLNKQYRDFFMKNLPWFSDSKLKARRGKTEVIYFPVKFEIDRSCGETGVICGWLDSIYHLWVMDKGIY
jgi:hypothetical protein